MSQKPKIREKEKGGSPPDQRKRKVTGGSFVRPENYEILKESNIEIKITSCRGKINRKKEERSTLILLEVVQRRGGDSAGERSM